MALEGQAGEKLALPLSPPSLSLWGVVRSERPVGVMEEASGREILTNQQVCLVSVMTRESCRKHKLIASFSLVKP